MKICWPLKDSPNDTIIKLISLSLLYCEVMMKIFSTSYHCIHIIRKVKCLNICVIHCVSLCSGFMISTVRLYLLIFSYRRHETIESYG